MLDFAPRQAILKVLSGNSWFDATAPILLGI